MRRARGEHAHGHGELRHLGALRLQHFLDGGGDGFLVPLHVADGGSEGIEQRRGGLGDVLGVVVCVALHGVYIEDAHPVRQIDQRFAAVLEQRADARQALVGRHVREEGGEHAGELRVVHGLEVLGVDPAQLGLVELAGAAAQVVEVEPFEELRAAEDFVVAVAPAQAGEVVDHGVCQIAFVAVLRNGFGTVALAHLFALLIEHGGQVGIHGRLFTQSLEDIDLPRCVVDVVVAANDVGDAHVDIVHHHAEVVGGRAVGAGDNQIVQLVVADFDAAFDFVVPRHYATLRVFEAQHRLHAFGHGRQGFARLGSPGAVVARFLLGGHLAFAQGIEFFHAHVAGVNQISRLHVCDDFFVAIHALHLVERAFVGRHAQPLHGFENDIDSRLCGALLIGVFNPQEEVAALSLGKGPRVEGGADVAQMDETGGRRGKAGADFGHVNSGWKGVFSEKKVVAQGRGLQRAQPAFQIGLDVVQMLQPDGDADQVLRDACALTLLFRQAAV